MDKRTCPICNKEVDREGMTWSNDCHGITFRLLCYDCWNKIMDTKGYDGEYYSECDEQIEPDW